MTTEERDAFVLRHMGAINHAVQATYRGYRGHLAAVPFEDLLQEAAALVIQKAHLYDPAKSKSAYWIRQIVSRHLYDYGYKDRPVATREPRPQDSEHCRKCHEAAVRGPFRISMSGKGHDGERDIKDQIPFRKGDRGYEEHLSPAEVDGMLRLLGQPHQELLRRSYGIGRPAENLRQIAETQGCSHERVRQRRLDALTAFRQVLEANGVTMHVTGGSAFESWDEKRLVDLCRRGWKKQTVAQRFGVPVERVRQLAA